MSYQLPPPDLQWGTNGAPKSTQYDDIYFDSQSGIDETHHVFINHNHLIERWREQPDTSFTIAETGFGTGLNFLCVWNAWLETVNSDATLHFISVEKFPLSKAMLQQSLALWPTLSDLSDELIQQYPEPCRGLHRIALAHGRVQLTLWFGEAQSGFAEINADIDAWFLDGFAPSKNPEMWSDELFREIHRLSHSETTFATFTAAGIVRRGLQAIGFEVQKVKGFGQKREMLTGILKHQDRTFGQRMAKGKPWFSVRPSRIEAPSKVLVVGSGLAGSHTAHALAERGILVEVWESQDQIANGASGNPQGMIYPKLASSDTPLNRFYLACYQYTYQHLHRCQGEGELWQTCGLHQQPTTEKEQLRFEKILSEALYPSELVQRMQPDRSDLFLPKAGWVNPKALCEQLLSHPNIDVKLSRSLDSLEAQTLPSMKRWQAISQGEILGQFSHVILCQANAVNIADHFIELPRKAIRGQVSQLQLKDELALAHVVCAQGYVSPPILSNKGHTLHFGSSYHLHAMDESVRQADHLSNLTKLAQLLPQLNTLKYQDQCHGRVSFRCSIPDYAPIVGPIYDGKFLMTNYEKLRKDAKWLSDEMINPVQGLYINLGHGSKGLVSTPLSACYLTSLILNESCPIEQSIIEKLHPNRFSIRKLTRS